MALVYWAQYHYCFTAAFVINLGRIDAVKIMVSWDC